MGDGGEPLKGKRMYLLVPLLYTLKTYPNSSVLTPIVEHVSLGWLVYPCGRKQDGLDETRRGGCSIIELKKYSINADDFVLDRPSDVLLVRE